MTKEEKILFAVLILAAVFVPAGVGLALHWSLWLSALLVIALLLVPFQVRRGMVFRSQQEELRRQEFRQQQQQQASRTEMEVATTPPPQFQREIVASVALDSATVDYDFLFSAIVYWRSITRPGWQHANPAALAAQSIIARAREITVLELPQRHAVAQVRLNSALGAILGDGSGFVEVWAEQVQLTLSDNDLARLRTIADARKDQDVWELERHNELDKRAYLADDVLKNTGSAVVWWLAHADGDVRGTVDLIDNLRRLTAAAHNTDVPELDATPLPPTPLAAPPVDATIAGRVRDLMASLSLDEPAQALFVRRLAKLVSAAGHPNAAGELVAAFDPAAFDPAAFDPAAFDPAAFDPAADPAPVATAAVDPGPAVDPAPEADPPTLPRLQDAPPPAHAQPADSSFVNGESASATGSSFGSGSSFGDSISPDSPLFGSVFDLPRVTDLPPEPDWAEPSPVSVADSVPEWSDGSDRPTRSDPSGMDSQ
jgi:hypothetical protein